MRKLLLLALLLYDIVDGLRPNDYDYDDPEWSKRHSFLDRRNFRKQALLKSLDLDRKDWDRRRYEQDTFLDDEKMLRKLNIQRDMEQGFKQNYEDLDKLLGRSGEQARPVSFVEKDVERKTSIMNCDREHERFETCFAGCAAITCDNPKERLHPCYPFCEPGCVCVHPFVRDDRTHKCVLPDECTKGLKGIPDIGDDV